MKVEITESFDWRGAKPPSSIVRLHRTKAGVYDDLPPEAIDRAQRLGVLKRVPTRKRKLQTKVKGKAETK